MLDDETIRTWKANYKLDTMTPAGAMTWWYVNNNGMAPAGAVAALGLALEEIERLKQELKEGGAMKLTEQHVSDKRLSELIDLFFYVPEHLPYEEGVVKALLELKQRRAEDRQREAVK